MISSLLQAPRTINEHLSTGGTDANHDLTGSTIRHNRFINGLEGEHRLTLQVPQLRSFQGDRGGSDERLGLSADLMSALPDQAGVGVQPQGEEPTVDGQRALSDAPVPHGGTGFQPARERADSAWF